MIRAVKSLKKNPGVFLLFEVPFRIFLFFLLKEGGGRIIDFLLHFQGYSYVTQGNYKRFLSHPSAIAGLCITGLILLFLILFESCGLFLLFDAGSRGEKLSLASLILLAGRQTFDFIRRYPFRWITYLIVCLPNLYLHLLLWEVDRARFIDIVVKDICSVITIPGFAILLALYFIASTVFSLALPFRIFRKEVPFGFGFLAFFRKRKKQLRTILDSLFLHIRVILATALLYLALAVLCVLAIRTFRPIYRHVSDTLFYGSILKMLIGILIGFFGTVTITDYLYAVFRETESSCICWEEAAQAGRPELVLSLVLAAAGAVLIFEGRIFIPNIVPAQDYLEITAHRGGARFAPENTMAAIQYSIDTKADYAEIDVQETKDGEIVLMHDNWLGRTTGVTKYIWNTSYEEVQQLDAGSFFSRAYEGEPVPLLRDVLQACRGKLRLNIEIKANGHNKDIVPKVLDIIREENFLPNCIITSMDYKFLKQIKELCPEAVTGYTLYFIYGLRKGRGYEGR